MITPDNSGFRWLSLLGVSAVLFLGFRAESQLTYVGERVDWPAWHTHKPCGNA
jgi:hypothetical protein